jgi:hypothetical protein
MAQKMAEPHKGFGHGLDDVNINLLFLFELKEE